MDAFASDSLGAQTPTCAHTSELLQLSRGCRANTCPQMHLLCPRLQLRAKWPRYYLHWKTLESTARHTQLKAFPLGKCAEMRHAGPRGAGAPRGSGRVQEAAMFALCTLPLCPPTAARPGAFGQPESLTRDRLFPSILRRDYT